MWTLGIDPGKKNLGWAIVAEGEVIRCGLSTSNRSDLISIAREHAAWLRTLPFTGFGAPDMQMVIEQMQQDGRTDGRTINRILELNFIGGWIGGVLQGHRVSYPTPREWKGGIKKEVMHRRLYRDLSPESLERMEAGLIGIAKGLHHNVLDAVGLALWGDALA